MQQKLAIAYLMAIAMLLQSRLSFPNTGGITISGDTLLCGINQCSSNPLSSTRGDDT
jgi:hypothetical protein